MDIDQFQRDALRTDNRHLDDKHGRAMAALGLVGEAGEVAETIKKLLYHGHDVGTVRIAEELGDVLWYVAVLADRFDLRLSDIAKRNVAKLRARYPDGFSPEASRSRC